MKQSIELLCKIAAQKSRTILGLMSGTSLDGLDLALCRITGSGPASSLELLHFATIPFEPFFREQVLSVFAKKQVDFEKLCLLNPWIARQHAGIINRFLADRGLSGSDVDLLASHGQTVYHAPLHQHGHNEFGNATMQIGDGDHLAVATGIITISDFRQKHIAAGGEGAPLAVYGDYLLFSKPGENRIMLNMGGIANFTWLPGTLDVSQVFSTDTGPGNTLLDAYMRRHFNQPYDRDAALASRGTCHPKLLEALLDHPFFVRGIPKTTGPELFNPGYLDEALAKAGCTGLPAEDVMATLVWFTATTIADAIRRSVPAGACTLFASGGGIHNPLVMQLLREQLPGYRIETTAGLSVHPDAKEAVLFAILANECVAGEGFAGNTNPAMPQVSMGKISLPR